MSGSTRNSGVSIKAIEEIREFVWRRDYCGDGLPLCEIIRRCEEYVAARESRDRYVFGQKKKAPRRMCQLRTHYIREGRSIERERVKDGNDVDNTER